MKLYADEPGSDQIRGIESLVVSCLARVEVPAAIWRKHRIGELSVDEVAVLVAEFEADYLGDDKDEPPRLAAVGLPAPVLERAARLVATHGLRAYDGVQLASALEVSEAAPEVDRFATFDTALRSAALAEGLRLLPA